LSFSLFHNTLSTRSWNWVW